MSSCARISRPPSRSTWRLVRSTASRSITVSTLKEAEHFARHGYADIVCATAIVPAKLAHAVRIREATGCDLILVTDAFAVVREAARFAQENRAGFSFLVEIDCGEHRSGLLPADAAVVEIARTIDASAELSYAACWLMPAIPTARTARRSRRRSRRSSAMRR